MLFIKEVPVFSSDGRLCVRVVSEPTRKYPNQQKDIAMTGQSAFSKKSVETINVEKRDWMEELNLPPQLISFLKEHGQRLQLVAAGIVLILLSYNGYQYYAARQQDNATAMLATAMKSEQAAEKSSLLGALIDEYGSSDAAVWAHLELGHMAYNAGQYDEAISQYTAADSDIKNNSSIKPFVHYGLAYSYEKSGDTDKALSHYASLASFAGYEKEASLGIARIQELKNDTAAALAAYRKAAEGKTSESGDGDWISEKISQLAASSTTPASNESKAEQQ